MKEKIKNLIEKYKDQSSDFGGCVPYSLWWRKKLKKLGYPVKLRRYNRAGELHYFLFIGDYIFDPTYRQFFFEPDKFPNIFFGTKRDMIELAKNNYHFFGSVFNFEKMYLLG